MIPFFPGTFFKIEIAVEIEGIRAVGPGALDLDLELDL